MRPVGELLQQRPPLRMVDNVLRNGLTSLESELTVRSGLAFVEDGKLSAEGLLENVSQTCALRLGLDAEAGGGALMRGVIAAVRDFRIIRRPVEGERIETSVHIAESVLDIIRLYGVVRSSGETIASGYITVVVNSQS